MITRRVALKQLAIISAGAALVTSCLRNKDKTSKLFKNITITEEQEKLISAISETLLPKTSTPGAIDVSASQFTAKMVDDCLSKKDQAKWMTGMTKFYELAIIKNEKPFSEWSVADREKILNEFEEKKIEGEEVNFFYQTVRKFTLQAYTTSEYYLTTIQNYKMLPGRFKGCVPLNNPS
jgi:hypothetical protein